MRRLIRGVGRAVAVEGVRALRGELPFDEVLFDVAAAVRRFLGEDELLNELQSICRPAAAAEIRHVAERVVPGIAPDLSVGEQRDLVCYLTFVPAAVRQAFKRPDDPAGGTIPAGVPLYGPEDLVRLLPACLPRFRPGDRPAALGGWELLEWLGTGGVGEVWTARNVRFASIRAAVKLCGDVVAREALESPEGQLVRCVRYVQSQLPPLAHGDGIVPLQSADLDADPPWLRYQPIEGHNLAGLVLNWANLIGPERARGATAVVRRLARIVGQFHRLPEPIVHRDLKPANVLVCRGPDEKMRLRVSDYGISQVAARRALEQADFSTPRGNLARALRGTSTALYASPQQKRRDAPDVRDDVFALGVLWYQLLLGDLAAEPPLGPWRERVAQLELKTALLDLLEECVAEDAERRPYDAAELAERLAGKPPSPRPAPPPAEPPPPETVVEEAEERAEALADGPPVPAPVTEAMPALATVEVNGATEDKGAEEAVAALVVAEAEELAEPVSEASPVPPTDAPPPPAPVVTDEAEYVETFADGPPEPALQILPDLTAEVVDGATEPPGQLEGEVGEPVSAEAPPSPPDILQLPEPVAGDEAALTEVRAKEVPTPAPEVAQDVSSAVAAVEVNGTTELAEKLADEHPEAPIPALVVQETEEPVEPVSEATAAPLPDASPPPLEVVEDDAEWVEVLEEEPPAPPPSEPVPVAGDEATLPEVRAKEVPTTAPEVAQDVSSAVAAVEVNGTTEPAEKLADEHPEAPIPALVIQETEELAVPVLEEALAPPPDASPPPLEVVEDDAEWVEVLEDEPPAPPPSEPAAVDDVAAELSKEETPVPPPMPAELTSEDVVEVVEVLEDEAAAAPPPAEVVDVLEEVTELLPEEVPTTAPVPLPVPVTPARERFVEVVVPFSEDFGEGMTMRFAWVPPGEFLMGGARNIDEQPARLVTIRRGFYLGVFPVTQAQWRAVMHYNISRYRGDDRPVEMVSWNDCQKFCRQLQELTGKPIRLPTEAEWEYACRAGSTGAYYSGDGEEALRKAGWYQANGGGQTHPVGQLAANPWGLHDLHGNVWEWCQDWYGSYLSWDATDPQGPEHGEERVLRGGSWRDPPEGCRSTSRGQAVASSRFFEIGCRVCFQPE